MLVLCSLLFQAVVIFLQNSDELFVIINLFSVQKLDLLSINAIVLWHVSHFPQSSVLSEYVFQFIGLFVDLLQQFHYLFVFRALLSPEYVYFGHALTHVNIPSIELEVGSQSLDLILHLLLSLMACQFFLVEDLNSRHQKLVF